MPSSGTKRSLEGDDVEGGDSDHGTVNAVHDVGQNMMPNGGGDDGKVEYDGDENSRAAKNSAVGSGSAHRADDAGHEGVDEAKAHSPVVASVLDRIGIEVYKYLHPRDLFSLSLASRRTHEGVSRGLIQTCLRQLPPDFGGRGSDHRVSFRGRHTFRSRGQLLDHLLDKCRAAELKILGAEDRPMEESLARAREVLGGRSGARFVSVDPELADPLGAEYTSAGYHFDPDNRKLAASRAAYIVSRMATGGEAPGRAAVVRTWVEYVLSQRHVAAGTWFWSCRHRSLDFQGVEGKGVTISSPKAVGEEMEILWTRLTASRV